MPKRAQWLVFTGFCALSLCLRAMDGKGGFDGLNGRLVVATMSPHTEPVAVARRYTQQMVVRAKFGHRLGSTMELSWGQNATGNVELGSSLTFFFVGWLGVRCKNEGKKCRFCQV